MPITLADILKLERALNTRKRLIVEAEPGPVAWADVTGKPATFAPVIGGGSGDAVAGNDSRLTDARAPTSHSHPISQVTDLQTTLDGKAAAGHPHAIADVTSLQTTLDGKQVALGSGNEGDSLKWQAGAPAWVAGGGGADGEVAVLKTGDTANSTTSLADAAGLSFTAAANKTYMIEGFIVWSSSATGVGIKLSATGPTSPTIMAGHFIADAANGTPDSSSFNANNVVVTTSASPFTTGCIAQLACVLVNGANAGTFQVRFAAETTGTITVKAGSCLRYRLLN